MSGRPRRRAYNREDREGPVTRSALRQMDEEDEELDAIRTDQQEDGRDMGEEEDKLNNVPPTSPYGLARQGLDEMMRNEKLREPRSKERPYGQRAQNIAHEEVNSSSMCFSIFVILLIIIAMISGFVYFDGKRYLILTSRDSSNEKNEWQTFVKDFDIFEKNYSEILPKMGTKVLKSAIKNVMDRKSITPAVILLIASEDNEKSLKCVERDLVNIIGKAYDESESLVIDGRQTNSRDLNEKFEQTFGSQHKHSIVIENIEAIPAHEVMSLHQFTDHENAKYHQVIIVLTALHYQEIDLTRNAKLIEMDEIATSLFQMKWKNEMAEEQRFALISRLTPSVVTLIGQKEC